MGHQAQAIGGSHLEGGADLKYMLEPDDSAFQDEVAKRQQRLQRQRARNKIKAQVLQQKIRAHLESDESSTDSSSSTSS